MCAGAPGAGGAPPSISVWACAACTFKNASSSNRCTVCGTGKPGAQPNATFDDDARLALKLAAADGELAVSSSTASSNIASTSALRGGIGIGGTRTSSEVAMLQQPEGSDSMILGASALLHSILLGHGVNAQPLDARMRLRRPAAALCAPLHHISQVVGGEGDHWACGYRNLQQLLSALAQEPEYARALFKPPERIYGSSDSSGFSGVQGQDDPFMLPDVTSLQLWIEAAWAAGFDVGGAAQLGGKLYNQGAKWIGTSEVVALLRYFGIPARIVQFHSFDSPYISQVASPEVAAAAKAAQDRAEADLLRVAGITGDQLLRPWAYDAAGRLKPKKGKQQPGVGGAGGASMDGAMEAAIAASLSSAGISASAASGTSISSSGAGGFSKGLWLEQQPSTASAASGPTSAPVGRGASNNPSFRSFGWRASSPDELDEEAAAMLAAGGSDDEFGVADAADADDNGEADIGGGSSGIKTKTTSVSGNSSIGHSLRSIAGKYGGGGGGGGGDGWKVGKGGGKGGKFTAAAASAATFRPAGVSKEAADAAKRLYLRRRHAALLSWLGKQFDCPLTVPASSSGGGGGGGSYHLMNAQACAAAYGASPASGACSSDSIGASSGSTSDSSGASVRAAAADAGMPSSSEQQPPLPPFPFYFQHDGHSRTIVGYEVRLPQALAPTASSAAAASGSSSIDRYFSSSTSATANNKECSSNSNTYGNSVCNRVNVTSACEGGGISREADRASKKQRLDDSVEIVADGSEDSSDVIDLCLDDSQGSNSASIADSAMSSAVARSSATSSSAFASASESNSTSGRPAQSPGGSSSFVSSSSATASASSQTVLLPSSSLSASSSSSSSTSSAFFDAGEDIEVNLLLFDPVTKTKEMGRALHSGR